MKIRTKSDDIEVEVEMTEGEATVKWDKDQAIKLIEEVCSRVILIESERIKNQTKIEP